MEIIFLTKGGAQRKRLHAGRFASAVLGALLLATVAGAFLAGLHLAGRAPDPRPDLYAAALRHEVAAQRERVDAALRDASADLEALARRVGELQARAIRIDALGRRLVEMAELDPREFDFDAPPPIGGPAPPASAEPYSAGELLGALEALSARLADRMPKLETVETALMSRKLLAAVSPSGRPAESGWLSSFFGWRTDPVSGRRAFHEGLDLAGVRGTRVVAAAAGVVIWSGPRGGYGNLVEINHGNGFVTRYAHNEKNLVKTGETVDKGQPIALMGDSGHVTGVHVHFEVLKDGKPIDPLRFVRAGD